MMLHYMTVKNCPINRPYRDAQNRLLWIGLTCPAHHGPQSGNNCHYHYHYVSRRVSGCKTWCSLQGDADLQSTVEQQSSEIASLREQCSNHAKERAALKTILDAKIKALVDDIGQSVSDLPPEVSLQAQLAALTLPKACCAYLAWHCLHSRGMCCSLALING